MDGGQVPFLSVSSTSVVAAGFVGLLRSIDPELSPAECMNLLIDHSRPVTWDDPFWERQFNPQRVVDIGEAARDAYENVRRNRIESEK